MCFSFASVRCHSLEVNGLKKKLFDDITDISPIVEKVTSKLLSNIAHISALYCLLKYLSMSQTV